MKNKLRIPAIMTFFTGVVNIILSVILVKYTGLGVYGVALATSISIFGKTILFNVIYASKLLEMPPLPVWLAVVKGIYWPVIFGSLLFVLFNLINIDSIVLLVFWIAAVLLFYLLGALYLPLKEEDRRLLLKLSKLDKIKLIRKSSKSY